MSFDRFDSRGGRGHHLAAGAGHPILLAGWSMHVKVTAADTGGRMTLLEAEMAPHQAGPLDHIHTSHDEAFFLLEGSLRFRVGDGYRDAVAGEVVFASRGLAHGFGNPNDAAARYLVALTPSGYEVYFERLAARIRAHGAPPGRDELVALLAEHGTYLAAPVRTSRTATRRS